MGFLRKFPVGFASDFSSGFLEELFLWFLLTNLSMVVEIGLPFAF